jgi:hypothetical protein
MEAGAGCAEMKGAVGMLVHDTVKFCGWVKNCGNKLLLLQSTVAS